MTDLPKAPNGMDLEITFNSDDEDRRDYYAEICVLFNEYFQGLIKLYSDCDIIIIKTFKLKIMWESFLVYKGETLTYYNKLMFVTLFNLIQKEAKVLIKNCKSEKEHAKKFQISKIIDSKINLVLK